MHTLTRNGRVLTWIRGILRRRQHWRALAYQQPQKAVQTIATTLAELSFDETHEWMRMAALVEMLEELLVEFLELLVYVGAINDFVRGNDRSAIDKLKQISDANQQIQIADVDLPIPVAIQKEDQKTNPISSERKTSLIDVIRQYSYWLIGSSVLTAVAAGGVVLYQMSSHQAPPPSAVGNLADVPHVPSMTVRYGGSTTLAPLRSLEIVSVIEQSHPGFRLIYTIPTYPNKPGSGSGIKMLIDGDLSVAQSSRSLRDEEFAHAKDRGFTLEQVPVAIDSIAVYIHP